MLTPTWCPRCGYCPATEFKRLADSVPVLGSLTQSYQVWRHAVKGCGKWVLMCAENIAIR